MVNSTIEGSPQEQSSIMTSKNHILGYSYLRAVACIAIIVLHTVYSTVLLYGNELGKWDTAISMVIVDCMMWAVPCFIMVTGALLLDPKRTITYKKLFRKYIFRIFAALILFGMFFRIFDMLMDKEPVNIKGFLQGIYEIFTGTSWSHIWYLYLLIGLYLLLPFYKKIADNSGKNEIKYLLGIYVLFLSILPLLQLWNLNCGFYIHVSTIYPFYLFCGYAISKYIIQPSKAISLLLFVIGTVLIMIFTIIRWLCNMPGLEIFWGYSSFLVIIQAIGLFSLLKDVEERGLRILKWILIKIDACSFGIYLIHMIFVRLVLRYMEFNPYKNGGVIAFIVLVLGILIISYIVTWILKKIPFLKSIV